MNDKDKQAVEAAKASRQTDNKRRSSTGRAQESATTAGNTIQEKLSGVSDRLAENIKKQILGAAVVKVIQDIESGDFGNLADEMFAGLEEGINAPLETEYKVLQTWQNSPKYALSAAVESNG